MHTDAPTRLGGPEVADAAVLASLSALIASIGSLLPHVGALELLSVVPLAILAERHRLRAVLAAGIAGAVVAFLVGGGGAAAAVVGCALVGALLGTIRRRGRGVGTVVVASVIAGAGTALLADAVLLILAPTRDLLFTTVRSTVLGIDRVLAVTPVTAPVGSLVDGLAGALLQWWGLTILVAAVVIAPIGLLITWTFIGRVVRRLILPESWGRPVAAVAESSAADTDPVAPVPVRFDAVRYRYPGADGEAVHGIDLLLDRAEFVVISGDNGSGKSTLVRLLTGERPTSGEIRRAGAIGLGLPGGTALVLHRPESQVLGATVEEDVRWGLPAGTDVDVASLLAEVGLAGFEQRSTSALSGGQLQRLAIATALARRPRLLVSDESTAMIDPEGRREVVGLLADLPRRHGMTVVHITHSTEEMRFAERRIRVVDGAIVSDARPDRATVRGGAVSATSGVGGLSGGVMRRGSGATATALAPARPGTGTATLSRPRPVVLSLHGVEHAYDAGTPWEVRTLRSVDLDLREGEGVLVTGENGGGKTTLAWILAGLEEPTRGSCLLDGRPVSEQVGRVALSFQHARLQALKATVREEILSASGRGTGTADDELIVADALDSVGLPGVLADRSVEQLSGGQLRRVVLAGLMAAGPRILVLDEPFAGLDADSRHGLALLLARIRDERGLCIVLVSHDVDEAAVVCTRQIVLEDGVIR